MTHKIGDYATNKVYCADALSFLKTLPDNSINTCITSPPYFGLRSYTDGDPNEIGKEQSSAEYVAALVAVFREVRRVLRDDGNCWINIGDSFSGSANSGGANKNDGGKPYRISGLNRKAPELGEKQLMMIPARVAIALQADGWYLRSEIIWHTPNAVPESVRDRPSRDFEHVFLLAKNARYFYDADAIAEPVRYPNGGDFSAKYAAEQPNHGGSGLTRPSNPTRNKRSVWRINTGNFGGAHFAVMPEKLVEPCVLAGCPETCCAVCGAPYARQVERKAERVNQKEGVAQRLRNAGATGGGTERVTLGVTQYVSRTSLGFAPTCSCDGGTRPGVVLDPFGGAATVGIVARRLKREFLLIELNPKYVEIANERLSDPYQLSVF